LRRRNLKATAPSEEDATSRDHEEPIGEERREEPAPGATGGNEAPTADVGASRPDVVERALADALTRASAAGQWEAVACLAGELAARRKARATVVHLRAARIQRKGKP
jgi:hypothetical protein